MGLGAELLTRFDLVIDSGRFIEMWLKSGDQILEDSAGRDEFRKKAFFAKGSRVAATGRLSIWDLPSRFRLGGVRPSWPVPVNDEQGSSIFVEIRTNIAMSYLEFVAQFRVALVQARGVTLKQIDLDSPSVRGRWLKMGRFSFLIKTLF